MTRLAAEAWLSNKPYGIPATEVPALHGHKKAVDWIKERIFGRLNEPLKNAVSWVALLRWFDFDSLNTILALPQALTHDNFRVLTNYAFIIRPRFAPDKWACHDWIRRAQITELRDSFPEAYQTFHLRAQEYYNMRDRPLDALYHTFFSDPLIAFEQWQQWESEIAFSSNHETWAALFEVVNTAEVQINLIPEQRAETAYRAGKMMIIWAKLKCFNLLATCSSFETVLIQH